LTYSQPRAKPGTSAKVLETKLKHATEDEAKGLLQTLMSTHPEIMQETLEAFQVMSLKVTFNMWPFG
jgi:hypothetical protein